MTEDQAYELLGPYLNRIAFSVVKSFDTYRTRYPHRPIHRRTTTANVVCDEVWADIVNAFAEDAPQVRPIHQGYGLRLIGIQGPSGETEILLWFKKVDGKRKARSYPTRMATRRLAGENLEMFKDATVLIVGYHLSLDETKVVRLSIFRPSTGKPEWSIDLELPDTSNVVKMNDSPESPQSPRRVVVRRIKQSRLAE